MLHTALIPECTDVVAAIRALRRWGPVVALESALPRPGLGQRSFVAGAPLCVAELRAGRWRVSPGRWKEAAVAEPSPAPPDDLPFRGLDGILRRAAEAAGTPVRAFGFFGYECVGPQAGEPRDLPDAWFLLTEAFFQWSPDAAPRFQAGDADLLRDVREECGRPVDNGVDSPGPSADAAADRERGSRGGAAEDDGCEGVDLDLGQYRRVFQEVREELRRGNSYQLCFTYPLRRRFEGDPLCLYGALRECSPAPFAGFLETGSLALVSSSPERFLRVDPTGHVEARPMKGTARKSGDACQDQQVGAALRTSVKDRAENLMIADLLRNDLGRVCRLGSVQVSECASLEEYATVFQLVSCIEGDLEAGRDVADLLAAAFPPGSMTGAPKVRSVEILRRLEARPRGPYSGILGHWGSDGTADFSVLIRTWVVSGGVATAGVGGGIVWDSRAEAEFQESRVKAAAMLRAMARVSAARAREQTAS